MELDIQRVESDRCQLGEGPVWDIRRQRLVWVDILGQRIYAFQPTGGRLFRWQVSEMVGFVLPCDDERWIAGLASGIAYLTLDENPPEEGKANAEYIKRPETQYPDNRFNDGACDSAGRLWCGTMHMPGAFPDGKLYRYDPIHGLTIMDSGYVVPNGPAFSNDGKTLYHCESSANVTSGQGIFTFDLDTDGSIHNKRMLVDYSSREGAPDGLTVDADDRIWVGEWGGARVTCFSAKGDLLCEIPLPATNVTKPAFGGENLDTMYVTTASVWLSAEQNKSEPKAGSVFAIKGVGKGLAPNRFRNY